MKENKYKNISPHSHSYWLLLRSEIFFELKLILLIFFQLYLCLVRIVPNTPIPLYINMFTTVLKTYSFILLSYFAFLLSFAFAFSLVYAHEEVEETAESTDSTPGETDHFGTLWLSLVKVGLVLNV